MGEVLPCTDSGGVLVRRRRREGVYYTPREAVLRIQEILDASRSLDSYEMARRLGAIQSVIEMTVPRGALAPHPDDGSALGETRDKP